MVLGYDVEIRERRLSSLIQLLLADDVGTDFVAPPHLKNGATCILYLGLSVSE